MTHICISKLTTTGSDSDLAPGRHQAIIWTNAGLLLIGPSGTNFSEFLIETNTFSFKEMHLNMSSGKWQPFCLSLNMLMAIQSCFVIHRGLNENHYFIFFFFFSLFHNQCWCYSHKSKICNFYRWTVVLFCYFLSGKGGGGGRGVGCGGYSSERFPRTYFNCRFFGIKSPSMGCLIIYLALYIYGDRKHLISPQPHKYRLLDK